MHIKIVHLWPDCIFIISSCQQLRLCPPQLLGFVVLHTHTHTHTCRHLYSTQLLRFSNKSHAWIVNISTCALGTNERQLQLQLLLLSSRHFMPIYTNSYIKCVFNTTYISAQMCVCLCIWQIQVYLQISAQIIARTCAQRLLLQFYDSSILHIFYVSPAFCCC